MARTDWRVEGRLGELEAIFRSEGFEFTDRDRGHLREYLGNEYKPDNDGHSRYPLIDSDASRLAHSAAAFDWQAHRPLDDRQAPTTLAGAHRPVFGQFGGLVTEPTRSEISQHAVAGGENLRNLSDPKSFAKAAGEYYAAVTAAKPYGRGSGIAAQLHVDRQAKLAGHNISWQQFHEVRNASAGQGAGTSTAADRASWAERGFSAAIFMRQFRTPEAQRAQARQATQQARTAGAEGRSGALGRLKRGLGLGRRQERQARDARGGQRTR